MSAHVSLLTSCGTWGPKACGFGHLLPPMAHWFGNRPQGFRILTRSLTSVPCLLFKWEGPGLGKGR